MYQSFILCLHLAPSMFKLRSTKVNTLDQSITIVAAWGIVENQMGDTHHIKGGALNEGQNKGRTSHEAPYKIYERTLEEHHMDIHTSMEECMAK